MARLSLSPSILILLVIIVISVIKCSETGRVERPASYHPRRLRMVYRDRTTPRKYILATRDLDLRKLPGVKDIIPIGQVQHSWKDSVYDKEYPDPLWTKQWYVQDYRKAPGPEMDLNVVPGYRKGITGKGITVAVIDNGIEREHPDLVKNYWKEASYDYTRNKADVVLNRDEGLVQKYMRISAHGTLCAGIISMEAGNSHCGVGIAYDATLIDVKAMGEGSQTDDVMGKALNHRLDVVDIYSTSLGPSDDGDNVGYISQYEAVAYVKGVTKGRGGKGAIYVLPSGNGGFWGDNCSWDGQVNSIRTISIAGASFRGRPLTYSEPCSAVFATTYAKSVPYLNEGAVTADTGKGCSKSFFGTSAATPFAAGMFALMLQANKELTYRDVMHVIAMSSEVAPLAGSKGWYKNGAGFWVNNHFGFGLLNGGNMVDTAQKWTNVGPLQTCAKNIIKSPAAFSYESPLVIPFSTTACAGTKNEVNYLEQIEVEFTIEHYYRGALEIYVTSPSKTVTKVLEGRKMDKYAKGVKLWIVKSVHNWGEQPRGEWVLEVFIKHKPKSMTPGVTRFKRKMEERCGGASSCVSLLKLTMHGTKDPPFYQSDLPRPYQPFTPRPSTREERRKAAYDMGRGISDLDSDDEDEQPVKDQESDADNVSPIRRGVEPGDSGKKKKVNDDYNE